MHQYLFFIGDFPIRMYGLMLCTAIFLATGTAYFLAKQDGRWHEHILDIGIYGGFAGLIGGRLWDVFFFDWDYYSHHPRQRQQQAWLPYSRTYYRPDPAQFRQPWAA